MGAQTTAGMECFGVPAVYEAESLGDGASIPVACGGSSTGRQLPPASCPPNAAGPHSASYHPNQVILDLIEDPSCDGTRHRSEALALGGHRTDEAICCDCPCIGLTKKSGASPRPLCRHGAETAPAMRRARDGRDEEGGSPESYGHQVLARGCLPTGYLHWKINS